MQKLIRIFRLVAIIISMRMKSAEKSLKIFFVCIKLFTKYSYFVHKFAKAEGPDFPIQ